MTTTSFDRVISWTLDPNGDLFGDERERLRWYEGIALAAGLQWVALPWAAAVLVWVLGRPVAIPLGVMLLMLYIPMVLCLAYVRRRRVETSPRKWTGKALVAGVLSVLPYLLFLLGVCYAYQAINRDAALGAAIGSVVGAGIGAVLLVVLSRRRRSREAAEFAEEG